MSSPSKDLYKETLSEMRQVPVAKCDRSREQFASLTKSILRRRDVTAAAKILFAAMLIESRGTGYVMASDSVLAEASGISRSRIIELRKSLERAELIQKFGKPVQQVQAYQVLHGGRATGVLPEEQPKTLRHRPELRPCVLCKDLCVPRKRTGWCARCTTEARNRQITRGMVVEEVEKRLR